MTRQEKREVALDVLRRFSYKPGEEIPPEAIERELSRLEDVERRELHERNRRAFTPAAKSKAAETAAELARVEAAKNEALAELARVTAQLEAARVEAARVEVEHGR